jgi:Ca2+-transporting ATPase
MAVAELVLNGDAAGIMRDFHVEGTTYGPLDGLIQDLQPGVLDKNLQSFGEIAALCNDAGVSYKGHQFRATGLPTEAALKVSFLSPILYLVFVMHTVFAAAYMYFFG